MSMPRYSHEYAEAAELDWAVERFCQALRVRLFDGVRRGKRGWQCVDDAIDRAMAQLRDAQAANNPNDKSREVLDAAAFLFMEWWRVS